MNPVDWVASNAGLIGGLTWTHIWLTVLPTIIGLAISLPLGYAAFHYRKSYTLLVGGTSLFYTIPSLALFILLPRILGTKILDPINVVVALVIYTVALLVRVIADGLASVDSDTVDAARGIGYSHRRIFFAVELPIAVPPIISGLRVVVVSNVSIVTVAAVIGISQLGSLFTMGFTRRLFVPIVVGLIVSALLALVLDRLLVLAGRVLTPWVEKAAR
jgi:osmoprotectant transport system permease protein